MSYQRPNIIDLFVGVGGFSLGALRAGFDLALAVELDENAISSHRLNFPNVKHLQDDIFSLDGKQLLSHAGVKTGELDGLIGGPPCQGFSSMGKRNVDDVRNNLFVKFFELVSECKPLFFVAENVPGILTEQYADIRKKALKYVEENYLSFEPIKLKASDFGAPTTRERVFFIGFLPGFVKPFSHEAFETRKVSKLTLVADALKGLPVKIDRNWLTEEKSWRRVQPMPKSFFGIRVNNCIPKGVGDPEALSRYKKENMVSGCFGTRHNPEVAKRYGCLKPGQQDKVSKSVRLRLDGLCPTLRAGTGADQGSFQAVRPIHPTSSRVITPREAARLQGFPDWFRFAPSKWQSFRQIGNSVSPIVAEILFDVIGNHLIFPSSE